MKSKEFFLNKCVEVLQSTSDKDIKKDSQKMRIYCLVATFQCMVLI